MLEKLSPCVVLTLALLVVTTAYAKQRSRFVTAEMRANALENVKKFDWAKSAQQAAIANAARWANLRDDELWALVPSQELPRSATSTYWVSGALGVGCPNCRNGIARFGDHPWKCDPWSARWKIKCPNCGQVYPKNDFEAFYRSALDEHGFFRRALGDRSLLFNAEHPDPKDPLHKVYVDDGYGMVDEKGVTHTPVAHYVWLGQWRGMIYKGLASLANAYKLTGDPKYAHKAAVLLDRIADVYPEMDYAPLAKLGFECSTGGSGHGRIEGCIWECRVTEAMAAAYDAIFDGIQGDEELVKFCSEKSAQHKLGDKSSIGKICDHIETHLLLEILNSVTKDGRIWGNTGMHQKCLAVAAIALDRPKETEQWLDKLFDPQFPEHLVKYYPEATAESLRDSIPRVLVEKLDRDGMGAECGGYGLIWTRSFASLPEIMARYPDYTKHDLVKEYPKLKQCFLIESRLNCLDAVFPPIGDSGSTGAWGRVGDVSTFVRGYMLYKDPRMATLAWHYAGGDATKLRLGGDIFEQDPDALAKEIGGVAKAGEFRLRCEHLGYYGQAVLQTERPEEGRAVWIHYGGGKGHAHSDCLNLGLYAKNVDMLPDLGYPEYTGPWPKRHAWTSHTISHNTLMVNDTKSGAGGKINLFAIQPPLRVIDVSSRTAYKEAGTYRRVVALVDVSDTDSYVVDVFRARGGKNHRLSYHGPGYETAVMGLSLVRQAKGTFAGENVEFAQFYDGEKGWGYKGTGFMYLYDVERSGQAVTAPYTVDWKAEDLRGRIKDGKEPHLRLHALTPCDEVALASGQPPQNKAGNPKSLRYLIQSRLGDNLESQFVTVLEPYDKTPFVKQVRRLKVEHQADPNSVAAVAVDLADGRTDVIISCEEPTAVKVEGGIEFNGTFGLARLEGGEAKMMRLVGGTLLQVGEVKLSSQVAAYTGTVKAIDVSDPADNRVILDRALPAALVGQAIHFQTSLPEDTTYDLKAIKGDTVSTGDITLIAGFKSPKDFGAGYKYLVNVGDKYVVPSVAGLDR